jgi:hypothetical protein
MNLMEEKDTKGCLVQAFDDIPDPTTTPSRHDKEEEDTEEAKRFLVGQ